MSALPKTANRCKKVNLSARPKKLQIYLVQIPPRLEGKADAHRCTIVLSTTTFGILPRESSSLHRPVVGPTSAGSPQT